MGFLEPDVEHTPGFVRSPDGTITSFVPPFCNSTSTEPASINDEGVITGTCAPLLAPLSIVG